MKTESLELNNYHKQVHPVRAWFMNQPGVKAFESETDPKRLHAFLILWSGFSIKMTDKVEDWITRAGVSCTDQGFTEIGTHLKSHAKSEADHDKMLVSDLEYLVNLWNKNYGGSMTSAEVLQMKLPDATHDYAQLHESVIQSKTPYCQVAIEYEIERLSIVAGPRIIENVKYTLNLENEKGLSFLTEHALLDQGHTAFNMKLLEVCFKASTNSQSLIETGKKALQVYGNYLNQISEKTDQIFFNK